METTNGRLLQRVRKRTDSVKLAAACTRTLGKDTLRSVYTLSWALASGDASAGG
jgi:hypothetical protein